MISIICTGAASNLLGDVYRFIQGCIAWGTKTAVAITVVQVVSAGINNPTEADKIRGGWLRSERVSTT